MDIQVRLAEPFWRAVGQRDLRVTLEAGARLGDLVAALCEDYPALQLDLEDAPPLFVIGEDEANLKTPLIEGCRVHILWALAGG